MPNNLDFLDSIGTSRNEATVSLSNIEFVLYDWASKVIQDAQANLEKGANIASCFTNNPGRLLRLYKQRGKWNGK